MATEPTIYDIEDYETGKRYKVEAYDSNTTYDEAVSFFSGLSEQERNQYEVRQPAAAPQQPSPRQPPSPVAEGEVAVKTALTDEQVAEITRRAGKGQFGDVELLVDTLDDPDYMANQMTVDQQRQYLALVNNPNVTREQLTNFTKSIGRDVPDAVWAEIENARKQGTPFTAVASDYQQKLEELLPSWAASVEGAFATGPRGDDWLSQIGRGWMEAGQEGSSGVLGRTFADWLDVGGDNIDRLFPDLSSDERENLQEAYVAYLQRNVREDNERATANDSFIPWFIGQVTQPDASDLLGIRPAKLASMTARIAGKAVEVGGTSAIADIGYQALDISGGVQDEFDLQRTGMAALAGAALGTAGQGLAEIGGKAGRKADQPAEVLPTIPVPTSRRNSKAYRAQLEQAQDGVISQVSKISSEWTNSPEIEVHKTFKDVEGVDNKAVGVYTSRTLEDGTAVPVIKINTEVVLRRAEKLDVSPESVVDAVTFHEGLAHHGLSSLFREDLDTFLDDIYVNGSSEFRSKVDDWLKANPRSYLNYDADSRRILATEEMMAEWSEQGPLPRTFVDNFINLVKDFGRQIGARFNIEKLENIKYTTREVKAYLAVAHERTISGSKSQATPSVPKNMKDTGRPDEVTANDLINSDNQIAMLERMLGNYQPTTVDLDSLETDLALRGVPPSAVQRLVYLDKEKLVKRRMAYDIAAEKLVNRVTRIQNDIETNGLTPEKQLALLRADNALLEVSEGAFGFASTSGTLLNLEKRMKHTRKKTQNLREFLRNSNMPDHLAEPEQFLKYMAARKEAIAKDMANRKNQEVYRIPLVGKEVPRSVLSTLNVPRALMSSFDLSAPLRQGIVFATDPSWVKNFIKMFSYLGPSGKTNYDHMMRTVVEGPNYPLMVQARLAFSDLDGKLSAHEEDFQSDLARKIPGVKMSEQAYAGFLNKLRADVFNKYIESFKVSGLIPTDSEGRVTRNKDGSYNVDEKLLTDLGKFINSATGRAELAGSLQSMAPQLNTMLFSPRLIQSRVNMLGYVLGGGNLHPAVRKQVWRHMFGTGAAILLTLGLVDNFTEASVEWDPRSSSFLKIKWNKTYYDITGGFSQYLTLAAQSALWASNSLNVTDVDEIKSTSGNTRRLGGKGKFDENFAERLWRFGRGKLSPNASFVVDAMYKENIVGEPFSLSPVDLEKMTVIDPNSSVTSRMMPMHISSSLSAANEYNSFVTGFGMTAPGLFGVGANTYPPRAIDPSQTLDPPETFEGVSLTRSQKDWWEGTLNNHFKSLVPLYTKETGTPWEELSEEIQEQIISQAKEDARQFTREDAEFELPKE